MSVLLWLDRLNTFVSVFVGAAIRGAIVLILALAVTQAMRRRTAAARYLVWVGAIVVQLLLPVLSLWGPRWELPISRGVASLLPVQGEGSSPLSRKKESA